MKQIKPHDSLKCPCCGETRGPVEQSNFLKQAKSEVPFKKYVTQSGVLLENVYLADARKGLVDWACDICLQSQRAISGEPSKQLFCDFAPHFAFYDKERICRECGVTFTFFKMEQKHWYECLGFWVQAEKVRCGTCQQQKKQHDKLSQLIVANDYTDLIVMREIVAIYLECNQHQKAKRFLSIGKKKYETNSVEFSILQDLLESVKQG